MSHPLSTHIQETGKVKYFSACRLGKPGNQFGYPFRERNPLLSLRSPGDDELFRGQRQEDYRSTLLVAELHFEGSTRVMRVKHCALHACIQSMLGQIHDQLYHIKEVCILHLTIPRSTASPSVAHPLQDVRSTRYEQLLAGH